MEKQPNEKKQGQNQNSQPKQKINWGAGIKKAQKRINNIQDRERKNENKTSEVLNKVAKLEEKISKHNNQVKAIAQKVDHNINAEDHNHTNYQKTIIDPFNYTKVGVPNTWAYDTVKMNRKFQFQVACNATGCASVVIAPWLSDNTSGFTSILLYNATGYDGTNAGTGVTAVAAPLAMPAGNVLAYRTASMAVRFYTQDSALNRKGTLHGASQVAKMDTHVPGTISTYDVSLLMNLAQIQNRKSYKVADLCSGQAMQVNWLPYDDHDLEFLPINKNAGSTVATGGNDHPTNIITFIVTGANASSLFKGEVSINYELTVNQTSALFGMGTSEPPSKLTPQYQVAELMSNHVDKLTTVYNHHNETSFDYKLYTNQLPGIHGSIISGVTSSISNATNPVKAVNQPKPTPGSSPDQQLNLLKAAMLLNPGTAVVKGEYTK